MERKRKWNTYKIKILKKAKKASGFLKWISRANPFIKTLTLQKIWFGLGRSRLEYGAELFNTKDKWQEAETLQNKVMRFILKLKGNTNLTFMQGELNWLTLKGRRDMLRLRYWRKIISMKKNRLTKIAYSEEIKKERKISWAKQTKKILKMYGLEKYWKNQLPPIRESNWNKIVESSIKKKEEQSWNLERKKKMQN